MTRKTPSRIEATILRHLCVVHDIPYPRPLTKETVFDSILECDASATEESLERQHLRVDTFLRDHIAHVEDYRAVTEICSGLFLGSAFAAGHPSTLQKLGISHVLDCADTGLLEEEEFEFLALDLADEPEQSLDEAIPAAVEFIKNALHSGGRVFVHCHLGKSRSVAMVMAYLMAMENKNAEDALLTIQCLRVVADPNPGFMEQLRAKEAENPNIKPRPQRQGPPNAPPGSLLCDG